MPNFGKSVTILPMHTTDTRDRILQFIWNNQSAVNRQLQTFLGISQVGVSKQLRVLLAQGKILKWGKNPRHNYTLSEEITKEIAAKKFEEARHSVTLSLEESLGVEKQSKEVRAKKDSDFKARILKDLITQIKESHKFTNEEKEQMIQSAQKKLEKP